MQNQYLKINLIIKDRKLEDSKIIDIFNNYANENVSMAKMGKNLNIERKTISNILNRNTYTHIEISEDILNVVKEKLSILHTK